MSENSLKDGIKKRLRDPIWQAVGALVAVIAIILPFLLSNPQPKVSNRLMFTSQTAKDLTNFPESVSKRMRFLVDGKESHDLRLFVFYIEYKGKDPIRSVDFEEAIQGSIPKDRKLISVKKATNLEGPLTHDKETGKLTHTKQPSLGIEATILNDQTFQIKPLLLNPGEWFGLEIYTAGANDTAQITPTPKESEKYTILSSEVSWSCRVAGVQCPGVLDIETDFNYLPFSNQPDFLIFYVAHQGWEVYLIILLTCVSLVLLNFLARSAGLYKTSHSVQTVELCFAVFISLGSAEAVTDWIRHDFLAIEAPIQAIVLFWINVLIIAALAAITIWIRNKPKARAKRSPPPAATNP